MLLIDLVNFNLHDDDKILLVDSCTKDVLLESSLLSEDLKKYYNFDISYIGVSNDLGTNLLVFIDYVLDVSII